MLILLLLVFNSMTLDEFEKVKQASDHLRELKCFEAFLSSHTNLVLSGDCKLKVEHERATVPAVVAAEWLSGVRALLVIAQTRFDKIEINNING